MSSNFISGLVSGLDSSALIEAIITSRSRPVTLLQQRQAEKTAQLSAWESLEAILISLKVESDRLGNASLWDNLTATPSDEATLTASVDSDTALGSFSFFVKALAQAEQRQSQEFSSRDELVGEGTFSITVGGETTDLTVGSGTTLEELADAINESDAGASATIVRSVVEGTETFYMVLTADETGADSAITVGSTLTGGTAPDFSSPPTRDAQDATIHFGGEGGLEISSASNTFEDIVEGLSLTVHRAQEAGEAGVAVDVARDTEALETALSEFVDRYNSAIAFVNGQFRYDPAVGVRPPLMGNATLSNILTDLRSRVTRPVGGLDEGAFSTLFSVGIKSSDTGSLSFSTTEFQAALDEDFEAVANLFRASASFDVPGVTLLTPPTDFDLATAELELVITSNPTAASTSGDEINLAPKIKIDASNDTFLINIDGVQSEVLSIAQDTYEEGDDLAQAIQEAIDASEDLGALGVTVTFEPTTGKKGQLTFTSNRAGSDATIRLDDAGSNFASALGLSGVIGVAAEGTDVAGTVNGIVAEGNGTILTVSDDVENIGGMSFQVTLGDGEIPATITATFAEGMARAVSDRLDSLTRSGDGTLTRLGRSIQSRIDSIARDIDLKLDQLDDRRVRLQRKYASLEATLGQLQSQGNFLNAQLQSLNSSGFGINTGN